MPSRAHEPRDQQRATAITRAHIVDHILTIASTILTFVVSRGSVYLVKAQRDRAIEDFDEVIKLEPGFAVAFSDRASAYLNKRQYDRAIEDSDQAIKLYQTNIAAHLVRGVTNVQMQNDKVAITDFDTVLRLDPRDVPALHLAWHVKVDERRRRL